jgi:protein TonB
MKIKLILTFVFLINQLVYSQKQNKVQEDSIYHTSDLDVKPEYPGGLNEFYKFINQKYKIPKIKGLGGKVFVAFVVEKNGSLARIQIIRDFGYGTGKEAYRVLKLSPRWKPGKLNNQIVRSLFWMPITVEYKQ